MEQNEDRKVRTVARPLLAPVRPMPRSPVEFRWAALRICRTSFLLCEMGWCSFRRLRFWIKCCLLQKISEDIGDRYRRCTVLFCEVCFLSRLAIRFARFRDALMPTKGEFSFPEGTISVSRTSFPNNMLKMHGSLGTRLCLAGVLGAVPLKLGV